MKILLGSSDEIKRLYIRSSNLNDARTFRMEVHIHAKNNFNTHIVYFDDIFKF